MVKKLLKIVFVTLAAFFLVIQFFGIEKSNPPVIQSETLEAAVVVPADISQIIARSCNDCHSNTTVYPWYAYIQPSGWFTKSHIDDGRRKLNFSIFNTFSAQRRAKKFDEICEQVTSGEMPLPSYLWIHRDAPLSESDKKALCDWSTASGLSIKETSP